MSPSTGRKQGAGEQTPWPTPWGQESGTPNTSQASPGCMCYLQFSYVAQGTRVWRDRLGLSHWELSLWWQPRDS